MNNDQKVIRVLHIFPPSLKTRFGGQNIIWKSLFNKWDNPEINHLVLDTTTFMVFDAKRYFDFEYPKVQSLSTSIERAAWIFRLFYGLIINRKIFDLLHVHVLWWGSFLIGPWSKMNRVPYIYESVLQGTDTPSDILRENLGDQKLRLLRKFTGILAISDALARDYLDHGFKEEQVLSLPNPVDSNLFHPPFSQQEKEELKIKYDLQKTKKILIFVGSVIHRKGVDLLVKAFIDVKKQHPETTLLIVGAEKTHENPSLDPDFVESLHRILQENKSSSDVRFLGLVNNRSELADLYRIADAFIFPSRSEGLGNVVLEAMASGLPVIVSSLPVLQSVITDGENGLFVPLDDSAELTKTINSLWYDWEKSKALGRNAVNYVRTHHHFNQWQDKLTGFYRQQYHNIGRLNQ